MIIIILLSNWCVITSFYCAFETHSTRCTNFALHPRSNLLLVYQIFYEYAAYTKILVLVFCYITLMFFLRCNILFGQLNFFFFIKKLFRINSCAYRTAGISFIVICITLYLSSRNWVRLLGL